MGGGSLRAKPMGGMGGFGGALKQLSIGFASTRGKSYIHTKGFTDDQEIMMEHLCMHFIICLINMKFEFEIIIIM